MSSYQRLIEAKKSLSLTMRIYKHLRKCIKFIYRSSGLKILLASLFCKRHLTSVICLFLMMRVRINIFNMQLPEQYKTKAAEMMKKMKDETSLDFKFLLFSQFVRILFSNIIIR